MTAQKGKDLLLKVETAQAGIYETVAGLRAQAISLGSSLIDATDSDSVGQWRTLLQGAGKRQAQITGSGLFKDTESHNLIKNIFFNHSHKNWQIIMPDFGTIESLFQIIKLEYSGGYDDVLKFDIALESSGEVTFTAHNEVV